ncbi:MAG: cytochrome o ubiquinol oxidase subunit IV [bacterium]|nr:cytochrome o ubiquinol oxidase subunit IV [bacterium]
MKTLRTYTIGFALSIALTLAAFGLLQAHLNTDHGYPSHGVAIPVLVALAIAQMVVQLILFLHVGKEQKPRWNLTALTFALLVVAILVGGTLWIMRNLSHGQMNQTQPFNGIDITPQTEND